MIRKKGDTEMRTNLLASVTLAFFTVFHPLLALAQNQPGPLQPPWDWPAPHVPGTGPVPRGLLRTRLILRKRQQRVKHSEKGQRDGRQEVRSHFGISFLTDHCKATRLRRRPDSDRGRREGYDPREQLPEVLLVLIALERIGVFPERAVDRRPVRGGEEFFGEREHVLFFLAHVVPVPLDEPVHLPRELRKFLVPALFVADQALLDASQ